MTIPVNFEALKAFANRMPTVDLDALADAVHDNACEKGFHPVGENAHLFVEQMCNNLHDEVSELHEAWRNGAADLPCDKAAKMEELGLLPLTAMQEELADILIRVLDNARTLRVDIVRATLVKHAYNRTREFRHGNKAS